MITYQDMMITLFCVGRCIRVNSLNAKVTITQKPVNSYSGGGIISLSDKNEFCTLYDQNSTYNETFYVPPAPYFLPQYFVLIKDFVVYWLCSQMSSRCTPSLDRRKAATFS